MALRNSVFDRKGIMPEPEKELRGTNNDNKGPLSLTDEQARRVLLQTFQPKRHGLLQTLDERLHLRRSQLESVTPASPTTETPKAEAPMTTISVEGPSGQGRS